MRALDALAALAPAPGEILVVDDGSTDSSAQAARARGFSVICTDQPRRGPAHARNLGAAHARGEILFFVDADVLVYPDALARLGAVFADPNVAALYGSYDDAPADPGFLSQYKNLLHHYVHQTSREQATSFWAGCGAVRSVAFCRVGGFATASTRPSIEDIELGYRLRREGMQIRLVKDLYVKHLKRWSWASLLTSDIRDRALPWAELLVRTRELPADLNLQPAHRLSAVLCWVLLALGVGGVFLPSLWLAAALVVLALLALNRDLYRFFYVRRGLWFTLRAIPLHWFYYLYSSAVFGWVLVSSRATRSLPVEADADA